LLVASYDIQRVCLLAELRTVESLATAA